MRRMARRRCVLTFVCLQPKGGTVQDQYPVMRLADGRHYTMSLRMMKAVW